MSKKHLEALVREIATIEDKAAREQAAMAVMRAAVQFNPRFDAARFLAACKAI